MLVGVDGHGSCCHYSQCCFSRDFSEGEELKVTVQVDQLVKQATSQENLAVSYVGWCAFW